MDKIKQTFWGNKEEEEVVGSDLAEAPLNVDETPQPVEEQQEETEENPSRLLGWLRGGKKSDPAEEGEAEQQEHSDEDESQQDEADALEVLEALEASEESASEENAATGEEKPSAGWLGYLGFGKSKEENDEETKADQDQEPAQEQEQEEESKGFFSRFGFGGTVVEEPEEEEGEELAAESVVDADAEVEVEGDIVETSEKGEEENVAEVSNEETEEVVSIDDVDEAPEEEEEQQSTKEKRKSSGRFGSVKRMFGFKSSSEKENEEQGAEEDVDAVNDDVDAVEELTEQEEATEESSRSYFPVPIPVPFFGGGSSKEAEDEDDVENVEQEEGTEKSRNYFKRATSYVGNGLSSLCSRNTVANDDVEQDEYDDEMQASFERDQAMALKAETSMEEVEEVVEVEEAVQEVVEEEEIEENASVLPTEERPYMKGGNQFVSNAISRSLSERVETFDNIGVEEGLTVWRLENKKDSFGHFIDIGEEQYGDFYSGDCYIVLNSYTKGASPKLHHDLHFWLGEDSTIDEQAVVAMKAVEIDDRLGGDPIQHREVEFHESKLFQSYFKRGLHHMKGGNEDGFNHIDRHRFSGNSYKRFYMVKMKNKNCHMYEVTPSVANMNHGDVFVLDLGDRIYQWNGLKSNPKERFQGCMVVSNIVGSRAGFATKSNNHDEQFWKALGAKNEEDVPTDETVVNERLAHFEEASLGLIELYRISDSSGKIKFTLEEYNGKLGENLDTNDVFLISSKVGIWIWEGKNATAKEMDSSFKIALDFIKENNLAEHLPITRIRQGKEDALFEQIMNYDRNESEHIKRETRESLEDMAAKGTDVQYYEDLLKREKGVAKEIVADYINELKRPQDNE